MSHTKAKDRQQHNAKIRMGVWILLLNIIGVAWAAATFPFAGLASGKENVVFSLLVSSPCWVCVSWYLFSITKGDEM